MPRDSESDFRAKLDAAREWEKRLARWIRSRGWFVVPTYDFSGKGDDKAPKLLAPLGTRDLVLPDLQCFRDGEHQWLECKWKTCASFYRKGGHLTTGIATRLLAHYVEVQRATRARVVLAFLHEREMEIRGGSLDALGTKVGEGCFSHASVSGAMGSMSFWRYEEIPRWADLGAVAEDRREPRAAAPVRLAASTAARMGYRPEHGELSPEEEALVFGGTSR